MRCAARLLALCAALLTGPAQAHDTWVMPAAFRVPLGQQVPGTLSAGQGLTPLSAPRRRRLRSLALIDADGRHEPLRWRRGREAAQALFGAAAAGVACLALTTRETTIEIADDIVEQYLDEVQPPAAIVAAWQAQHARGQAWVERYAKDAKTYLRSGRASAGWPQLALLGQRLELIAAQDPTRLEIGHTLVLSLLLDGRPVADAALRLCRPGAPERVLRTDPQGRAAFTLEHAGAHLVATTVLALPAAPDAPWTSRFATLGFGVGRS